MTNKNVMVVEDDASLREALGETIALAGFEPILVPDSKSALCELHNNRPCIVVSDINMDGMDGLELLKHINSKYKEIPVLLITAYGNVNGAVSAIQQGAVDYLVKPFEPDVLIDKINKYMTPVFMDGSSPIAEDPRSKQLLELTKRVASSDATVLIAGESGTGKEVLARYVHDNSERASKKFIALNCAAIPENMLEAMLFGYEKGAFTGAVQATPGKFELAQGGTLLLDEISEMDINLQAKLLRVLQERELERIGGKKVIKLDVRVIATTNRNLKREVDDGNFREDLYYRLNVFPLNWIPLRDRPKDILPLAHYLLSKHAVLNNKNIPLLSEKAQSKLEQHSWPGNAREMDNVIQRAFILSTGNSITENEIQVEASINLIEDKNKNKKSKTEKISNPEYENILVVLKEHKNSKKDTAEALGISPRTLRYKLAQMREQGMDV